MVRAKAYCTYCDERIPHDSHFCPHCGMPKPPPETAAEPTPVVDTPQRTRPSAPPRWRPAAAGPWMDRLGQPTLWFQTGLVGAALGILLRLRGMGNLLDWWGFALFCELIAIYLTLQQTHPPAD